MNCIFIKYQTSDDNLIQPYSFQIKKLVLYTVNTTKIKKLGLNLQLQTIQNLTSDGQILILCLSCFISTVNVKTNITFSKLEFSINFQPICDLIAANEEENNGSTLIHCMQGRSRSASLVIAYLLWKDGCSDASGGKDTKDKG